MRLIPSLTAVILLTGALMAPAQEATPPAPSSAEITLEPIDSARLAEIREENRGKILVINMWATWCPPCVAEYPYLVEYARSVDPEKVVVIAISSDYEEDVDSAVMPFLRHVNPPFQNFIQNEHEDIFIPALDPLWSGDYPRTVFHAPDGEIVERIGVFHGPEDLERIVSQIASGEPVASSH